MAFQLDNEFCWIYEQNNFVIGVRVYDWTVEWLIIASNAKSNPAYSNDVKSSHSTGPPEPTPKNKRFVSIN